MKRYALSLTKEELWVLSQSYAASFTAPDERSEIEVRVSGFVPDSAWGQME